MIEHHLFLGGQDLEMETIRQLSCNLPALTMHDQRLKWGAKTSDYANTLLKTLESGAPTAIVELTIDMINPDDWPNLTVIDHHGAKAGADQPSSLRQLFNWLTQRGHALRWTRIMDLVSINDIAHIDGLLAFGASDAEIRHIRAEDRRVQGISAAVEAQSKADLANGQWLTHQDMQASKPYGVYVVETKLPTSSAIADFAHPFYTQTISPHNLLVMLPDMASFYGAGHYIQSLTSWPDCWFGGALPDKGFWGASMADKTAKQALLRAFQAAA